MEIRPLRIEDYDALIGLWTAAGLPYKPRGRESREAIEGQMNATPNLLLGAWEGGRLVGAVIGSTDGRKGWINRLAVHPDCRRKGYGKALVAATEAALRERGLRITAALIEEDNEESLAFFEALGYKVLRIRYLSKRDGPQV